MPFIVAGGALLGGLLSSNASSKAAKGQEKSAQDANELQKYIYDNNVKLNQPAIDAGNLGRNKLMQMLGLGSEGDTSDPNYGSLLKSFTGADLQSDPGYQFGLAEGYKGLDRRAAAGGGYFSGAALKAAQRYGQDYAGTKFGEAYNRDTADKTNIYNRLAGLTGGGQVAANQTQAAGGTYANQVGSNLQGAANAQGASDIASANAWGNTISGATRAYQDYNANNNINRNLPSYNYSSPPTGYAPMSEWEQMQRGSN